MAWQGDMVVLGRAVFQPEREYHIGSVSSDKLVLRSLLLEHNFFS